MNYYIADLHVGHGNVMKYDNRPWDNLEDMETGLIAKWNSKVKPEDTVYILGDFIWGKEPVWKEKVPLFNGKKVLIRGNHDLKEMDKETRKLFVDVKDYLEITDNRKHVVMCHYPIVFYNHDFNKDCYMLCGHVHLTKEDYLLEDIIDMIRKEYGGPMGNIINVGCMQPWIDYEPKSLEEILDWKRAHEEGWDE